MLHKLLLFLLFSTYLFATQYSTEAVIILHKNSDKVKQFAAKELQEHLELILNQNILITTSDVNTTSKYKFYIGKNKLFDNIKLKSEESLYIIDKNSIYLYGDDLIIHEHKTPLETVADMKNKTGTLFAIYDFLYNELNVKWTEPGNKGIFYIEQKNLDLKNKKFSWYPIISFRYFRNDIWRWNKLTNKKINMYKYTPKELQPTQQYVEKKEFEELIWKRRMKQGTYAKPAYGHAFTRYWDKYGKNHPEWFALGANGLRGLEGSKSHIAKRLKLCISNNDLQKEIINTWHKDFLKYKNYNIYNACINDSRDYCRCKECRALDHDFKENPSKNFETESKTDRYVYFWNQLITEAKKFNPKAKIIAYAYSDYRYPPKYQQLKDDIILGFVPKFTDLPQTTKKALQQWKTKGLKEVFLRPNDFNDDIGMPMGHEKYIYDKFKVFNDLHLVGVDYDRSYNFNNWAYDGISYYILAQAINNPNKTFKEIEQEYYSTFKNAQTDIEKFYKYWRTNFEKNRLAKVDNFGGFSGRRNLYKNIEQFYTINDFIVTNQILQEALRKVNDKTVKRKIEKLIISNKHSELLFIAIKNKTKQDYDNLIHYRINHKKELNLSWAMVFYTENRLTNIDGTNIYIKKVIRKLNKLF